MVQIWRLRLRLEKNLPKTSDNVWDPTHVRLPAKPSFYKWVKRGPEREVTCPRSRGELVEELGQLGTLSQLHRLAGPSKPLRGSPAHLSLGRRVYCKTPPRADRSPGLCRSAAGGAAPTPPGPCAAWEGRPDRARRLTAGPARGDLMLTWSRAVALSNRGAGRPPFSARGLFSPAASRAATQPEPPQRATPPAAPTRPASAITRLPAPGRSHTPPTALIGSLPHPPGASGHSIGLSRMSVK